MGRVRVLGAFSGADIEGDDDEHPGADELDQRDLEQRIGEQHHAEAKRNRANCAKKDSAPGIRGRQSAAGEGDDDGVVGAQQQVDKEDLQQEKEPSGRVDHRAVSASKSAVAVRRRLTALDFPAPASAGLI